MSKTLQVRTSELSGNVSNSRKSSFHTRVHSCGMKNRARPHSHQLNARKLMSIAPERKIACYLLSFLPAAGGRRRRVRVHAARTIEADLSRQAWIDFPTPTITVLPFLQQTHLSLFLWCRSFSFSLLLSAEIMPNRYSLACVGVGRRGLQELRRKRKERVPFS